MAESYSLSRTNTALLVGCVALQVALQSFFFARVSPEQLGEALGAALGYFLWPFAFSWLAWRFSGRSNRVGAITFNVLILLLLFSQFNQFSQKIQDINARHMALKREMVKEFVDGDGRVVPEKLVGAFKDFADKSTGPEKIAYQIMQELISDSVREQSVWHEAFLATQTDQFLDFVDLKTTPVKYDQKQATIDRYLACTQLYEKHGLTFISRAEDKLKQVNDDSGVVEKLIGRAVKAHASRIPAFQRLIAAHREYGNSLKSLFDLLRSNDTKWIIEDGKVAFTDEITLRRFREITNALKEHGAAMDNLSEQLQATN